jgi:hypothetical protein
VRVLHEEPLDTWQLAQAIASAIGEYLLPLTLAQHEMLLVTIESTLDRMLTK